MLISIYKRLHSEEEAELCVEGQIHPANLGYWMGALFEPDCDIVVAIKDTEDEPTLLEEDVERTIH